MTNLGDNTRVSQVETRSREREAFISARSQLKSPHVLPPQKLGLMREKRNPEIRTVPKNKDWLLVPQNPKFWKWHHRPNKVKHLVLRYELKIVIISTATVSDVEVCFSNVWILLGGEIKLDLRGFHSDKSWRWQISNCIQHMIYQEARTSSVCCRSVVFANDNDSRRS